MLVRLLRRILHPLLWKAYRRHNKKPHWQTVGGLQVFTAPGVFHPRWFLTTRTLTDFALSKVKAEQSVLELGAGNGVLALSCSRTGAQVTASDINPAAVTSIEKSAKRNKLELTVIQSDLFLSIPQQAFDFIFINPPYFPQAPRNDQERAFLCGENFEYFQRFFSEWQSYATATTFMILTDACDLSSIQTIASEHRCHLREVASKKTWGEQHLIFQVMLQEEDVGG